MQENRIRNTVASYNLPTATIMRELKHPKRLSDEDFARQRDIDAKVRATMSDMIGKPSGFPLIVITGGEVEKIDSSNVQECIRSDRGDLCITLVSYDTAAEAAAGLTALAVARGSAHDEYAFYACIGELAESLVEDVRRHNGE